MQDPSQFEAFAGFAVGLFIGLAAHCKSGRICLFMFVLGTVLARIILVGGVQMDLLLDNLLLDFRLFLDWVASKEVLVFGGGLGIALGAAIMRWRALPSS